MALCSLCQNIPFSSLPAPPEPDGCSYTADNKDLIQLWYRGSKALPKDDIGYLWHEHLDALAKSTSTGCPLCSLVHAGVQTWVDRYRHEAENNKSFKEFHGQMELIPEGQQLWVTARFGGAAGFIVLVRNPSGRSSLYLLTGVGFSVDSGMYGSHVGRLQVNRAKLVLQEAHWRMPSRCGCLSRILVRGIR